MNLFKNTYDINSKKIFMDKLLSLIIAISPIFLQYHFFILTYGLLILMITYFFLCIKNNKLYIDRDFVKLGIIIFIQQIFSMIIFNTYSINFMNTIIMVEILCIVVILGYFIENKNILYSYLKKIAIVCTFIVFVQFILHTAFKMPYKPIILLPQSEENLNNWLTNRPSGFFTEPQVYSTFITLIMMIVLQKGEILLSIFLFGGIILCGSSSGIILALIILLYYLTKSSNIKFQFKFVFIICIIIGIIFFVLAPTFSKYFQKILSIFNDMSTYVQAEIVNDYSYTNYLRLFKSWQTIFDLPFEEKIVGIGINNFTKYLDKTDAVFKWNNIWKNDAANAGYYSSAGGVFIDCGMLVAVYYYYFLLKKYNKANTNISKGIIMLIVIQSIYTQIFFNSIFLYYFLLYNAFLDKNKEKSKIF